MQVWPSLTQIEYAWRRWQGPKGVQAGVGWGAGRERRQDACAGRSAAVAGPAGAVARLPPTPTPLTPPNADADAAASNADGTNLPPTPLSPPPPAGQRSPTIGIAMVRSRKTSEGDDTARPAMDLDKIIKNLLGVRKKIEKQLWRPSGSASASSMGTSSSAASAASRRAMRSASQPQSSHLKQAMAVLQESQARQLCLSARDIFLQQPMLLELEAPVNIVGDIHGQFEDLLRHFDKLGYPPAANYLFLGDYVDRGRNSLEVICLLLAYKLKYPNNFFLLRGNHECASINRVYGFYEECKRRYSIKLWKTFTDLFNCLPVAALVEGTIFCTHGGLSPQLSDLNEIRNIPRPIDVPDSGLVCDLLWSDPAEGVSGWAQNDRGVSFVFGRDVVQRFLQRHGCSLIVRAHQVVEDGYQFFAERSLLTLFSAPNYCGEFDNAGAVLGVSEDLTCWFSVLPPVKKKMFVRYK